MKFGIILSRIRLRNVYFGAWPSGKAPGFGPGIRGFESLRPSQEIIELHSNDRRHIEIIQRYL